MRLTRLFVLFCLMAFTTLGCSRVEGVWKDSVNMYYKHIHPRPTVDLAEKDVGEANERRLAELFAPVDSRIESLRMFLQAQDDYPEDAWFDELFQRYPWISGAAALGRTGEFLAKRPEASLKPFSTEAVLALSDDWAQRRIMTLAEDTDLGPEIYLAKPFYKDNEWYGLTVVHFDPRAVISFSPNPDALFVLAPGVVLWSGKYDKSQFPSNKEYWDAVLEDHDAGELSTGGGFYWLARALGHSHLIYATVEQSE